ncbi:MULTISPECIES: ABC transporter ATP-binding protein [unclassified Fusibacter]|uniref:ATP-binding cassette domain-containing protein n=1 Tax=unclassified Fusibacter TaxID=2624464 RepID=UPI0010108732|nr:MULTISPECIES: ABC transporter ATP-binding protein [unclassified Fusibacter]MCK8058567.1 ABC transporter ATP-binding protein/permease [Fusibacter sp. A2]NPE22663.1 ABC transporter ATP-binding protein [Fusibacter sp. A1]RXV60226.1 ABC transporter ATP-binding protein [Fusibacter sp. A1]
MIKQLTQVYKAFLKQIILVVLLVLTLSYVNVQIVVLSGSLINTLGNNVAFMPVLIFFAVMMLVQHLLTLTLKFYEERLNFRITNQLKALVYEKLIGIKTDRLMAWSHDDLFQMWSFDIDEIQKISVGTVTSFSIKLISAFIAVIQLSRISVVFTLIGLFFYLIAMIPIHFVGKLSKRAENKLRQSMTGVNKTFYFGIDFIRLIKTYGKTSETLLDFEKASEEYSIRKVNQLTLSNLFRMVALVLKSIAPIAVLLLASSRVYSGSLSLGDLVVAMALLGTISAPISEIGTFLIQIRSTAPKIDRLFDFLSENDEQADTNRCDSGDKIDLSGDITFENVSVVRNGQSIVSDVSFIIQNGEKVAIVGESGCGKTTIANLLTGLIEADVGQIKVKGKPISSVEVGALRKQLMYVESDIYLSNDTLLNNLTLLGGCEPQLLSITRALGFNKDILNMDEGFQTVINANGTNVSGGQKKKIGFIRAASVKKNLYLLDEVTTGLDKKSAHLMTDYIKNEMNATVIMITHEIALCEAMDKVLVLKDGCLIDFGTHKEVYSRCDYYRELQMSEVGENEIG